MRKFWKERKPCASALIAWMRKLRHPNEAVGKKLARVVFRCVDVVVRHAVVRFRPWLNNGLIVVARAN